MAQLEDKSWRFIIAFLLLNRIGQMLYVQMEGLSLPSPV